MMRIAPRRQERGFTLIELLVVLIILGVLAAVAIPVYAHQRAKSVDAALRADLHNAATAVESWMVGTPEDLDGPAAPGAPLANYVTATDTLSEQIGFPGGETVKVTAGNFVEVYANTDGGYCIAAANRHSSRAGTGRADPALGRCSSSTRPWAG